MSDCTIAADAIADFLEIECPTLRLGDQTRNNMAKILHDGFEQPTIRQAYKMAAMIGLAAESAHHEHTGWISSEIVAAACERADLMLAEDAAHAAKEAGNV